MAGVARIEPAALSYDSEGTPMSARYGDLYASRDGALGQAMHVFLGGTGTLERWRGRDQFVILETGFGLGTNFLAVWRAWRAEPERPRRLHFVSVERHPVAAAALAANACDELKPLAIELAARWPPLIAGLHRLEFDAGCVTLTLALGGARELAPMLMLGADAIFLDGFAPDRNPEMWEPALLRAVARLARTDCRLATWSTARRVREALAATGFDLELATGFGHKRQMLVGRYAPRYTVRRHDPPAPYAGERRAMVVGAGLAGAACAHALARRGWSVAVIESARPAAGASALPWGLMHPHFAADDNVLARLTRAGAAHTVAALQRVAATGDRPTGPVWRRTGVFQQIAEPSDAPRWRVALDRMRLPAGYVRWMDCAEAADLLGADPARSGLWWPDGHVVAPAAMVGALLDASTIAFVRGYVGSLRRSEEGWQALGASGELLAQASVLVVAAALDGPRLLDSALLPVQSVPGQVTVVEAEELAGLRGALGGDGTLLRAPDGALIVGATYETPIDGQSVLLDDRTAARSNLARLERLLANAVEARVVGRFAGARCVARDRLPYAGSVADELAAAAQVDRLRGAHFEDLPRRSHLYASFALGSRGLTFAALAGEMIAAQIEGEPAPLERDLANALDPGRVLLRRLRKGQFPGKQAARH
jgi:tRNA 5-methylaminomethyl-2-thiouridine biosynthesis bifunctional protein